MRCLNQWRHLKALKRGGRGHATEGADGTVNGELAIRCPSCPYPGINIPPNWKTVPQEKQCISYNTSVVNCKHTEVHFNRFLYAMLVCMDANFRLKNHLVSNFSTDPGLSNGMAYMTAATPL